MQPQLLDYQRRVLLSASTLYACLALALPTAVIAHNHLTRVMIIGVLAAGAVLATAVLRVRELGSHRGVLASALLLSGPVAPLWVARRTQRWKPLLMVRPRPPRGPSAR